MNWLIFMEYDIRPCANFALCDLMKFKLLRKTILCISSLSFDSKTLQWSFWKYYRLLIIQLRWKKSHTLKLNHSLFASKEQQLRCCGWRIFISKMNKRNCISGSANKDWKYIYAIFFQVWKCRNSSSLFRWEVLFHINSESLILLVCSVKHV